MLVVYFSCFEMLMNVYFLLSIFSPCIKSSVWFCSVILNIGWTWIFIIHPPTSILSKQLPQNLKFQNISKTEANLQIFSLTNFKFSYSDLLKICFNAHWSQLCNKLIAKTNSSPSKNTKMDTNFIQIDQVFHEIMQFLFLPLGGSSLLPKTEKC